MFRTLLAAGLMVGIVAAMGCTGVQKGTAAGSAVGSGAGAAVGHLAGAGSGPGAIVGFGLGAIGGAIAGEHYYGTDDSEELGSASDTIERLTRELRSREARLAEMSTTVEREKAQQKALLEAYEKARGGQRTLSATTAAEPDQGEEIKYTLLAGVLFDSGSAKLSKEGKAALKRTAQSLRATYPAAYIEVRGHTDNVPIKHSSFRSNRELSQARALSVVQYLVEAERFDSARLTTTGYGDTRPVASNKTAAGRHKNRRAEIVVSPRRIQMAAAGSGR